VVRTGGRVPHVIISGERKGGAGTGPSGGAIARPPGKSPELQSTAIV